MKQPEYKLEAFKCPNCDVYAKQTWYTMEFNTIQNYMSQQTYNVFNRGNLPEHEVEMEEHDLTFAECSSCHQTSIWLNRGLIYPRKSTVENPNEFMPSEVKKLYEEARLVFSMSPRSSAALLRLALEVLLPHIGAEKGSINDMIGQLARERKAIERVSKAMDVVRVTGNNAVHPGVLDIAEEDSREISMTLFKILNYIVAETLETDAMIDEVYSTLPKGIQENIEKRNVPRV